MPQTVNLDALRATPVTREPFPYLIVPNFIRSETLEKIEADYPKVEIPGSVPLPSLTYGPNFKQFIDEIRGAEMSAIIAEKFDMDLKCRPTTVTVRGQCRAEDGQIHTDSKTKLVTVLIYMNGKWEAAGGRLRLLRSPSDLNDSFAEVPPMQGTLLAFRNQSNAWHGHESFSGTRRAIQLNWVVNQGVVWREQLRHRLSAFVKKII
jgi:hypothetical protein